MTFCNDKTIKKLILKLHEKYDESISKGKEEVELEHCKEKTNSPSVLPFPRAMTNLRKVSHNRYLFIQIFEDLCIVKRKLNVKKKAL